MFEPVFPFQEEEDVIRFIRDRGAEDAERLVHALGRIFDSKREWLLTRFCDEALLQCGQDPVNLLKTQESFAKQGLVLLSHLYLNQFWVDCFEPVLDEISSFNLVLHEQQLVTYAVRVLDAMAAASSCDPLIGRMMRARMPASLHARFFFSLASHYLLGREKQAAKHPNTARAFTSLAKALLAVASLVRSPPGPIELEAWQWGAASLPSLVLLSESLLEASRAPLRGSLGPGPDETELLRLAAEGLPAPPGQQSWPAGPALAKLLRAAVARGGAAAAADALVGHLAQSELPPGAVALVARAREVTRQKRSRNAVC